MEATSVEADDFDSWARDLGYDPDSRSAERIYRACEAMTVKLHRFLGDEYDTFQRADRD